MQQNNMNEKLTVFIMLVVAFFAVTSGLEDLIKGRQKHTEKKIAQERQNLVLEIATRIEPVLFLNRSILPLLRLYSEDPKINLEDIRRQYLKNVGIDISLYQFDQSGKLIKSAPARAKNMWLMRNMYPALKEKDNKKASKYKRSLDKKIEFAFGYGKDLNSIRENPETVIHINSKEGKKEGFITWTSRAKGGLIITCQEIPNTKQIFRQQVSKMQLPDDLNKVGLLGQNTTSNSLPARANKYLSKNAADTGNYDDFYWVFTTLRDSNTLFVLFDPIKNRYNRLLHMIRIVCLALAIAIVIFLLISQNTIKLKKLLVSLFLVSSLLPMSVIAFTALDSIDIEQSIYQNKIRSVKEETMANIIQNFDRYLASCSNALIRLTDKPGDGSNNPDTIKMVKAITDIFPGARITLRNAGAEILYYNGFDPSEGRESIFKSIARRFIERYAPERADEHKYKGNPVTDVITRRDDMFIGVLNFPEHVQLISTGNSYFLFFARDFPKSIGESALINIEFSYPETIKSYLKIIKSKPITIDNYSVKLAAFNPKGYRWSLAPDRKNHSYALKLAETVFATNKPIFRRSPEHGFAFCISAKELDGNCLVAIYSDQPLQTAINNMKIGILIAAFIAFLLIYFIVLWLLKLVISPLTTLEKGIDALAKRKFEYHLPTLPGKDELATLFTAFNEMMAENYDMKIAHNVQKGLVPSKFPSIDGYDMFGILRPASELGGDCLDCFPLPDGNILFLVGDITGHGVASALIMAFSRAITFHWSQNEPYSPASLADQIDIMLRENHTSRMFMGIICGVLNIKTHEIALVIKGHIYPLKLYADCRTEWIGSPAYPLGIAKKTPAKSTIVSLAPGDSIICMTDGFLTTNNTQHSIGFDKLEEWTIETRSYDTKNWIESLEKRFDDWCSTKKHDDDVSAFILTRKSGDSK